MPAKETFDVNEYVAYAKSYAQSIGLSLDSTATECWDNPITANSETVQIGVNALRIICIGFVFSAVSVTCCGVLEALGKVMSSFTVSLMRYAVVIIPAAFIFSRFMGAQGMFWAFPTAEIITAVVSYFIYRRCYALCCDESKIRQQ